MELQIIISSILRRYDFVLEQPDKPVSSPSDAFSGLGEFNRNHSLTRVRVSSGSLWNAKLASSAGMFFSLVTDLNFFDMYCYTLWFDFSVIYRLKLLQLE
jgi:hypothetical protein